MDFAIPASMGFLFQRQLDVDTPRICLDHVVLQALSPAAYELATHEPTALSDWLSSDVLLRQGDVSAFPGPKQDEAGTSGELRFLAKLTEPVQRGYVRAGLTRISVIAPDASVAGRLQHTFDTLDSEDDTEEPLEIDESFLGNAIISPASQGRVVSEGQLTLLFKPCL